MKTTLLAAAELRANAVAAQSDRPSQRRASDEAGATAAVRAELRAIEIRSFSRNGLDVVQVGGYASVTESPYEMYDMFGPYTEVVSRGAFGKTLAAAPLVEFALNHGRSGGASMASTRNDTLTLAEDETGLLYDAFVDPTRNDVADMLKALERGDLAEASFKFRIDAGMWSPDWTQFRIDAVDLNRGDVSAVNFGANPAASSGLRSAAAPLDVVRGLDDATAREALRELSARLNPKTGRDLVSLDDLA